MKTFYHCNSSMVLTLRKFREEFGRNNVLERNFRNFNQDTYILYQIRRSFQHLPTQDIVWMSYNICLDIMRQLQRDSRQCRHTTSIPHFVQKHNCAINIPSFWFYFVFALLVICLIVIVYLYCTILYFTLHSFFYCIVFF